MIWHGMTHAYSKDVPALDPSQYGFLQYLASRLRNKYVIPRMSCALYISGNFRNAKAVMSIEQLSLPKQLLLHSLATRVPRIMLQRVDEISPVLKKRTVSSVHFHIL